MPTRVPPRPQPFQLAQCAVARPVSAAHGRRLCEDLAFVLAQSVESVCDVNLEDDNGTTPLAVSIFYARSPGVSCLLVGVELVAQNAATATITITDNGSALTWVDAQRLDGSAAINCPAENTHRRETRWGVVDVTGMPTNGTVTRLNIGYVRTSSAQGIHRVFAREIPQGAVDPASNPTTEVAANEAWPYPRRNARDGLVAGTTSDGLGWVRLEDQCEQARTSVRKHMQWCTYEHDTYAAQTSSLAIGPLNWNSAWTGGDDLLVVTRARRLYGVTALTAQPEVVKPVIRYKCGGTGGTLRFVVNGTNNDYALAAAAAWTTLTLSDLNLPTDQSGQRVEIKVHGKVSSAGSLRLANWTLITNEP